MASGLIGGPGTAKAGMVLTAAGMAQGFSLSTFATGFPSVDVGSGFAGPFGITFPKSGGVLVSDVTGQVRLFANDIDGQLANNVPVGQNYGGSNNGQFFGSNSLGLATVNGNTYLAQQGSNQLIQVDGAGKLVQVIATGLQAVTGVVANPNNGHLYVSTLFNNIIYDVDPVAKSKSVLLNASLDGLTLSADGKTLYGAGSGAILGFDLTQSGAPQVFNSGFIPGSADGAAIGLGPLLGNIYANTNGGTFVQINLLTKVQTVIGNGGSRGDFVTLDPNNGTLLLTQSDSILRLTPPNGGFGPSPVPEPATYLQAVMAACGLGLFCRFRRR